MDDQRLADLAERYWRFECEEMPFGSVLAGQNDSAILFRERADDHARRANGAAALLTEVEAFDPQGLSPQQRATHALLARELRTILKQVEVEVRLRPWLLPAGPEFNTVFFANAAAIADAASADLYVARLGNCADYLADTCQNMRDGHDAGIRYPRAVLSAAAANARGLLSGDVAASPWIAPFVRSVASDRAGVRQARAAAEAIVADRLLPALAAYVELLEGQLREGARDNLSVRFTPGGEAYYRSFVENFTSSHDDPEEVHRLGLAEVERVLAEMTAIATAEGHADPHAYAASLAADPNLISPSPEALRATLESLAKRIDLKLPAFFPRLPRITYGVDLIPPAMSAAMPPAYAQPGAADGSAPGIFWASSLVERVPATLHVPLTLHEAWPGHLMHIALLQEATDLPAFRRNGGVKYTACIEGWALYCEQLGLDMGLITEPHQNFGRLEMELWRAVRLVVDTGIHWYDWSRDRAIGYMRDHLTLDDATIAAEVDRYAALPGQALAYQIGVLKLRELRGRAEERLGEGFSLRSFHGAVMDAGAVTLPVLDDLIEDWIEREAA